MFNNPWKRNHFLKWKSLKFFLRSFERLEKMEKKKNEIRWWGVSLHHQFKSQIQVRSVFMRHFHNHYSFFFICIFTARTQNVLFFSKISFQMASPWRNTTFIGWQIWSNALENIFYFSAHRGSIIVIFVKGCPSFNRL